MTRVLMVNDISETGGGKTAMLDVASVLIGAGFELHLACPAGPLATDGEELGMTWHEFEFHERRMFTPRLHIPRARAVAARRAEGARLARLADAVGADILHTGATVPHLDSVAFPRPNRCRLLWHINQLHPSFLFAGPLPDRIVSVSAASLAPALRRAAAMQRATVVRNGVDLTMFRSPSASDREVTRRVLDLPPDQPTVLCVGRIEPLKGHDTLIRAIARTRSSPTLVIAGDSAGYSGGDRFDREMRSLAVELGVDARFLGSGPDVTAEIGPREAIARLMGAADLYASATRYDALPYTLIEASACGLPVVVSDVGGCSEIVVHDETGYLLDPDDVDAFASTIDRVATDAILRERLGTAARARMDERFDVHRLGERLVPIYEALAGRS